MGELSKLLFCSLMNFGLQTSPAQMTIVGVGRSGHDHFVRNDELESDNRSPLVSRSNPVAATFAFSAKLRKRDFRRLQPRVRG